MDVNYDYNVAFKSISVKLKKRFLRKPNVSDAIDEYNALSKQLEAEECSNLAAYSQQQVAKCFRSVGNSVAESLALQTAAKHCLNAHVVAKIESGTLTFDEHLVEAISLYDEAISLHNSNSNSNSSVQRSNNNNSINSSNSSNSANSSNSTFSNSNGNNTNGNENLLAGKLCIELADLLSQKFEKHFEAIVYYEKALSIFGTSSFSTPSSTASKAVESSSISIFVFFKLAAIKVQTADYSGALTAYSNVCQAILAKCVQPSSSSNRIHTQSKSESKENNTSNFSSNNNNNSMLEDQDQSPSPSNSVIYNKPIGNYASLLVQAEIAKLLLLMLLRPTKMSADHSQTIEVYSWFQQTVSVSSLASALSASPSAAGTTTTTSTNSNYMPVLLMDRDLFILLQSFVMSCQSNDLRLLNTLQAELWPLLDETQNFILNLIVEQALNSSYTDDLLSSSKDKY